ncbi:Cytochrome b5 [Syntrophobacter sp. SbD1]|nr:Cytochrome b5 [Syntrophobacter sp. SbD1]
MPDMELSPEELAQKDGKEGRPVYIAYEGKIYDVSLSKLWKTGTHMNRHPSGKDLTTDLGGAPHGPEVLDRYPAVGIIKREPVSEIEGKTFLEPLFKKVPFLRRHPHPMTVHFPIVFMLSPAFFILLYFITGDPSYEATAFHCLAGGVIFTPVVILTGLVSWWVNYLARPLRRINIKISVSLPMLAVSLAALVLREMTPDVLTRFRSISIVYLLLIFSLCPMILVIGWHGARLTFPIGKE